MNKSEHAQLIKDINRHLERYDCSVEVRPATVDSDDDPSEIIKDGLQIAYTSQIRDIEDLDAERVLNMLTVDIRNLLRESAQGLWAVFDMKTSMLHDEIRVLKDTAAEATCARGGEFGELHLRRDSE